MIKNYIISLKEFWPYYVREHSQAGTRWLHFIGNTNLLLWLIIALLNFSFIYLGVAIMSSYMIAWIGHFFVEKNKPATFQYPWWSLLADFKMFFAILTGRESISSVI